MPSDQENVVDGEFFKLLSSRFVPWLLLCPSCSDMLFRSFVSLEDHLKHPLGHLVLQNMRQEDVEYRSYREENVSKSAITR